MIVLKFGGTSVGNPDAIRRVGEIIRGSLPRRPLVVSSAVGGQTNRLFAIVEEAVGGGDWETEFGTLEDVHREILRSLQLDARLLDELLGELKGVVQGIALLRERTERAKDLFVSFGERLAVRILAAYLRSVGVEAEAKDAFDIGLITDRNHGRARPVEDVDARIRTALEGVESVPIVTGYIGKSECGEITTLGRGGSDYTAAIFGAALDAEEIQIWTDVDGVMTADPRIVDGARFLERLSFAEAAELAFYGAKVIHPATMVPAVQKNVPIRVLNSFRPEFEGTLIVADPSEDDRWLKSIASKDRVSIIDVVAARMLLQPGFIKKIADVFAKREVVIDMIATSEVSVSMTVDPSAELDLVERDLKEFSKVTVKTGMSQVSLVGEGISERVGFAAELFEIVGELGVNVEMISFGATRNNLSIVVREEHIRDVVSALHARFFER